jgi:hypothetical protein
LSHYLKQSALLLYFIFYLYDCQQVRAFTSIQRDGLNYSKNLTNTHAINLFVHDLMLEQFHRLVLRTSHKHTRERGVLKRARSFAQSIVLLIPRQLLDLWAPVETQTRKLFAQPSPFWGGCDNATKADSFTTLSLLSTSPTTA